MLKKSFERSTDRLHDTLEKRFDQLKTQVDDSVNSDEASSKAVNDLLSHVLTSVNKLGDRMAKNENNFETFSAKQQSSDSKIEMILQSQEALFELLE